MSDTNIQHIRNRTKELSLRYFFSFKGFIDGSQFFSATAISSVVDSVLKKFDVSLIIINFIYGYIMLIAFQKRCRDINIKGTLIIILATICFFFTTIFEPFGLDDIGILDTISKIVFHLYTLLVLLMFFYPTSPNRNADLHSPLLRYPYVYVLVCIFLALWGIDWVSSHQNEIIRAVTPQQG